MHNNNEVLFFQAVAILFIEQCDLIDVVWPIEVG